MHYPNRLDIIEDGTKHPSLVISDEACSRSGWWLGMGATSEDRRADGAVRIPSIWNDIDASYVRFGLIQRHDAPSGMPIKVLDPYAYGVVIHALGWLLGAHVQQPPGLDLPRTRIRPLDGIPWYRRGSLVTFHPKTNQEMTCLVLSIDKYNELGKLPRFLGCEAYRASDFHADSGKLQGLLMSLGAISFDVSGTTWHALPSHLITYQIDKVAAARCERCQRGTLPNAPGVGLRKKLNLRLPSGCLDCDRATRWPILFETVATPVVTDVVAAVRARVAPGSSVWAVES